MPAADGDSQLRAAIVKRGGLLGASDLIARWGVTRQRVHQIIGAEDFPRPVASPSGRPVWTGAQIEAWEAQRGS